MYQSKSYDMEWSGQISKKRRWYKIIRRRNFWLVLSTLVAVALFQDRLGLYLSKPNIRSDKSTSAASYSSSRSHMGKDNAIHGKKKSESRVLQPQDPLEGAVHAFASSISELRTTVATPVAFEGEARKGVLPLASDATRHGYSFPPNDKCVALNEIAEDLPDIVHVPFEEAVETVKLDGWEDAWFSEAEYDSARWGKLEEPKIDFVYTWINGSDNRLSKTMRPYELNSTLNNDEGEWLNSHAVNRYRDWDELRYSIRSIEKHAGSFRNNIQLLVNSVENEDGTMSKQRPSWLNNEAHTHAVVKTLGQEDFFGEAESDCLPTFNSLTIENQLYNTPSDTDRLFALSDDMFLGKPHSASDIYSPLFGPVMGFKSNSYNTISPPSEKDALRFGEKPFLIYTSWMLNRRFGNRKRKGQVHFGHSLSRSLTREAIESFPRPALKSSALRFRGETGFQLYSWYATFHYTMERHREALLWSYIMVKSDLDGDGNLGWDERQQILKDLAEGMTKEGKTSFRKRMFYNVGTSLEAAGLEAPKANIDTLWTSLDGPAMINTVECQEFDVNECLALGFSSPSSDHKYTNPTFSAAAIFDRLARQDVRCGDCLLKLVLNRAEKGLSPLLPDKHSHPKERETVIKAMKRYQYTIVEPDALFVMVTDAEQVENTLVKRLNDPKRQVGQLCLNDDVALEDQDQIDLLHETLFKLFERTWNTTSSYEL